MSNTISYGDFKAKLRSGLWPTRGEAHSLIAAHDAFFLEAMLDLAQWVKCLDDCHTDVHPACSTYVDCGKTVFDAPSPQAMIKRVYTIVNGDWCSKVDYDSTTWPRMEDWARRRLSTWKSPDNTGLPVLPQGLKFADASTDTQWGRSRCGLWTIHRRRLYLIPWVQSNEQVVVEWDGPKTDWQDTDLVDLELWGPDAQDAIKSWVAWKHMKDFEPGASIPDKQEKFLEYFNKRAELMYWCEQRKKQQAKEFWNRPATQVELTSEAPVAAGPQVLAVIGDWGMNNDPGEIPMSKMVHSWNPDYVVTVGDNWQDTAVVDTLQQLDFFCGQFFQDFMWPYIGTYGSGSPTQMQRLFAALGNHDRDGTIARLALVKQFFAMPANYYDFVMGPIHWFICDSGYDNSIVNQEADGITFDSVQGNWLQAKLALSTARFKIVILHQPPFSSTHTSVITPEYAGDGTISFPKLQWPFKAWGADAVMCGHCHNYERLLGTDGLPYLVVGTGGGVLAAFRDPVLPMSVVHDKTFGALKVTVDCNTLTLAWYVNGASTPFDTLTIQKP